MTSLWLFMSNRTLVIACASVAVAASIYLFCTYKPKKQLGVVYIKTQKPNYVGAPESHYFKSISTQNNLPIACIATLGGDIMMCPSNGVCPLNGERCQPQPKPIGTLSEVHTLDNKPCCTDQYYPWQTTYSTV